MRTEHVSAIGAHEGVDDLYRRAYDELTRLAAAVRASDHFATISTRTLVHETWLKFAHTGDPRFVSDAHLRWIVIRAMRQVLVDSARQRRAVKRRAVVVPLDDDIPLTDSPVSTLLAIHDVLDQLARLDPTQAHIVEARFFGDLGFDEIAEMLGMSESTVRRKWATAVVALKAWLDPPS